MSASLRARAVAELELRDRDEAEPPLWQPYSGGPQEKACESPAKIVGYGGQAGGGKACYTGMMIPTPSGWTTMGDIRPGDVLFDEQGRPSEVLAISEVFTDHDCYGVEFDDGEVIVADADHRWLTFTDKERQGLLTRTDEWRAKRRAGRERRGTGKRPDLAARNSATAVAVKSAPTGGIRTTREIFETQTVRGGTRTNHSVPVCQPLQLPEADLVVPPYTLGVWLGDGKTEQGKVYVADEDSVTIGRIEADGFEVRKVPSEEIGWTIYGLQPSLRKIGVLGNKHIPVAYLRASIGQRLELLRGLMDTDGTCDDDGGAEFTNTVKRLAEDTLELARTLGIKATLTEGRATLYGKDCGPKYRVKMTTNLRVFNLERKAAKQNAKVRQTQTHRYIVNVRQVESVPVKCLAIDSPSHLYLAGPGFIPTHNSDLVLGLAATEHRQSIIFRRVYPQLKGLVKRSREIVGDRGRYNGTEKIWRIDDGRDIEFGAVQYAHSVSDYKGRPHDLIGFDEATEFLESQVRFLLGWLRSADAGQRCRAVLTFNPPTSEEGMWIIPFFGPWLDDSHPNPALPGEIRWFAMVGGKEVERPDGEPFEHIGPDGNPVLGPDGEVEVIEPQSRTFFPARLADNPILDATDYRSQLQALPEPLRSQLLNGDFKAGIKEDAWKVLPLRWLRAAVERGKARKTFGPMTVLGMDVAHGGDDKTVLAPRHDDAVATLLKYPGAQTPDGRTAAQLAAAAVGPHAAINVDAIGWGASAAERLKDDPPEGYGLDAAAVNVSQRSHFRDKSGKFGMVNTRAEMYWRLREELDPDNGATLSLPDDPELIADLSSPRYEIRTNGIKIEDKAAVRARVGRSPDCGDAVALTTLSPARAEWAEDPLAGISY